VELGFVERRYGTVPTEARVQRSRGDVFGVVSGSSDIQNSSGLFRVRTLPPGGRLAAMFDPARAHKNPRQSRGPFRAPAASQASSIPPVHERNASLRGRLGDDTDLRLRAQWQTGTDANWAHAYGR